MNTALYVIKMAGQFAAADVLPAIEGATQKVYVNAALRRGQYEDPTKPYRLECIVEGSGGRRKRWVDWIDVQPKDGLTSVDVVWGVGDGANPVGCVHEVRCRVGERVDSVTVLRAPASATETRTQRMIKLG